MIWPFFIIWSFVGSVVVVLHLRVPFAGLADMIFLLSAALCLLKEAYRMYGRKSLFAFVWVAILSGFVEGVGTITGVPFGNYQYTEAFGLKLFSIVPLAIPLAWWVVLFPLYELSKKWIHSPWIRSLVVAFLCVWTDFLLEPMATIVRGYWIWDDHNWYYGVPFVNFLGWFILSLVLALGLEFILRQPPATGRKKSLNKCYFVYFCVTFIFLISSIVNLKDFGLVTIVGVSLLILTGYLVGKRRNVSIVTADSRL